MTCVYITSDWHLGHKAIANYRKGIHSVDNNTQVLVDNYKSTVTKRDIVWFLGDILFDPIYLDVIGNLPGDKRLILGNHCTDRKVTTAQLAEVFDQVHGFVKYKDCWLSHCPIHPMELRGRYNIHGHMHYETVDNPSYFNACVEHTNMSPIKYQTILEKLNSRNSNTEEY